MGQARWLMLACLAAPAVGGCAGVELRPGARGIFDAVVVEPTPAEAVALAVDPYDPDKRYRGLRLLGRAPFAGEDVYLRLFADSMDDPDARVRAAAATALANHGHQEHLPLLVRALRDPEPIVRVEAARALQRIHGSIAIDALIGALKVEAEPEPAVRAEVAHALGQYPQRRVAHALIAALADRSLAVNVNAVQSLRTLTGEDFGLDRARWTRWLESTADPFAARQPYYYPIFRRPKQWQEYLPFVPGPPNETPGQPVGMEAPRQPSQRVEG